jgi:hypothetical protein
MSKSQMPPVPPASRSPKGPGDAQKADPDTAKKKDAPDNLDQSDRQGNISQNTHHQGYQQDR